MTELGSERAAMDLLNRYTVVPELACHEDANLPFVTKAAQMGHVAAQIFVHRGPLDQELKLFSDYADNGCGWSALRLSKAFLRGIGVSKDGAASLRWLQRAVVNGHVAATSLFVEIDTMLARATPGRTGKEMGDGVYCEDELGGGCNCALEIPKPHVCTHERQGDYFYEQGREMEATDLGVSIELYKRAMDLGHPAASFRMGEMCRDGMGVLDQPPHYDSALTWFIDAARFGHIDGAAEAAFVKIFRVHHGNASDSHKKDAVEVLRQAVDIGSLSGKYNYAYVVFCGRFVSVDETKALRLWREAAESGHAKSRAILKEIVPGDWWNNFNVFFHGRGVRKDLLAAESQLWEGYKKLRVSDKDVAAARKRDAEMCTVLRFHFRHYSIELLADSYDPTDDLYVGYYGISCLTDPLNALSHNLVVRAAQMGCQIAQVIVGCMCEIGESTERSVDMAADAYLHAGAHDLLRRLPVAVVFAATQRKAARLKRSRCRASCPCDSSLPWNKIPDKFGSPVSVVIKHCKAGKTAAKAKGKGKRRR